MTARDNITRALRHVGLLAFISDIDDDYPDRIRASCAIGLDSFRGALQRRGWRRDPGKPDAVHDASESWREGGAVMPALQICFRTDGRLDIDLDFAAPLGGAMSRLP